MKTILVPTDFSETSINAFGYAIKIAKLTKAKIVLFHVYHIPVVETEALIMMIPSLDEIEKSCLNELGEIRETVLLKHHNTVEIECVCKCGFALEEITIYANANKMNLIVIGMKGTGDVPEKIMGSITTLLIKRSKCPVLSIDKSVKFRNIKKILLACDYLEVNVKSVIEPLKEIVRLFDAHVSVLNVVREIEVVPTITKAVSGIRLEHALEDIDHSFHYSVSDDIVGGINEFVEEQKMDMVVMIPRVHSAVNSIFHAPQSQKMVFHSTVPLLTLHSETVE